MKQVSCNLPNTDPRSEVKQNKDEAEAGSAGGKKLSSLWNIIFFKKALLLVFFSLYLIVSRVGVKIRNKANAGWSSQVCVFFYYVIHDWLKFYNSSRTDIAGLQPWK